MSVSSTVSNKWFTPNTGYKTDDRHYRSAEQKARRDEHAAASHVASQGDWVVKGKRHNKMAAKEQTPQEKAEAARIQHLKDLKAIENTLSGSMSVIRPRKRVRDAVSFRKSDDSKSNNPKILLENTKKTKSKISHNNSFSLLVVDSTDDEAETETFEVKPQEFPTLGATTTRQVETPSKISYSFALQSKPKKQIVPEDFPSPPKRRVRVCWADQVDAETSDEEDDFSILSEQENWGYFA